MAGYSMRQWNISGRVLVLAPHCDDEVLGCGGTLLAFRSTIAHLSVVYLTECDDERRNQAHSVLGQLDANAAHWLDAPDGYCDSDREKCIRGVVEIVQAERPDFVLAPHSRDDHPDHVATWNIAREAASKARYWPSSANGSNHRCTALVAYEVWTPIRAPALVVDITRTFARKCELIELYSSQTSTFPYTEYIAALNGWRGMLFQKAGQAEAFEVHAL
jgi:LmbE family N-acetylglucosaminyl deacetylase